MGRKPVGRKAMTSAERQLRYRVNKRRRERELRRKAQGAKPGLLRSSPPPVAQIKRTGAVPLGLLTSKAPTPAAPVVAPPIKAPTAVEPRPETRTDQPRGDASPRLTSKAPSSTWSPGGTASAPPAKAVEPPRRGMTLADVEAMEVPRAERIKAAEKATGPHRPAAPKPEPLGERDGAMKVGRPPDIEEILQRCRFADPADIEQSRTEHRPHPRRSSVPRLLRRCRRRLRHVRPEPDQCRNAPGRSPGPCERLKQEILPSLAKLASESWSNTWSECTET